LSCSDLGVIASHQEGFSNSLLEKMSAGLPVIATDVGGNGEAIIDNESGVLVPPGAPALMAKAVLTLANDTSLRSRLGRNARERVRQHFSLEHCADQYFDLYTQR
jgi:glycosyltransferase involved in cell wall biosynthesis